MTETDTRSLPRGLGMMLVAGTCIVALLITLVVGGRVLQGDTVTSWSGPIAIQSDVTHPAGEELTVTVTASAPQGTTLQLAIFAPLSATLLEQPLERSSATFVIDPTLIEHAGVYQLVAHVDNSVSQTHQIRVIPSEAVDPVVPLVGPRTIIADGEDATMTVVTPIDQFGNPVADGTEVVFDVLRPSGRRNSVLLPVEQSIAAIIIESTTETGRMTISATSGQAEGPSNVVDQVAGTPAPFTVEADLRNPLADGFTLHTVQTSELRDQFGNLLPDGVAAVFIVQDARGESLVHASVQGGIARAAIEAPEHAGELTLLARVSGTQSPPATLVFVDAVESLTASMSTSGGRANLTIGPVLTARGGYVPDGTTALISDPVSGATIASVALRGGLGQLELDAPAGALDVEVLGMTTTVEVEDS